MIAQASGQPRRVPMRATAPTTAWLKRGARSSITSVSRHGSAVRNGALAPAPVIPACHADAAFLPRRLTRRCGRGLAPGLADHSVVHELQLPVLPLALLYHLLRLLDDGLVRRRLDVVGGGGSAGVVVDRDAGDLAPGGLVVALLACRLKGPPGPMIGSGETSDG